MTSHPNGVGIGAAGDRDGAGEAASEGRTLVRARSAGCASRPAARGALMMDTPLLINGLLERALSERRTEKLISYAFDLFFLDG
jgi:hypothetical protein